MNIDNFLLGIDVAFTIQNLLYCFAGILIGTIVGMIPGLGPLAAMPLLLPFTYSWDPISAIIMMSGIYYGTQYGGSTTAILCKMPAETSSVVSMADGHALARKGYANTALNTCAIGSFIGGCVSTFLIVFASNFFLSVGLSFGPREYLALIILGCCCCVVMTSQSWQRTLAMILIGMLLAMTGTDPIDGKMRFNFGSLYLAAGLDIKIVILALYGVGESLRHLYLDNTLVHNVNMVKQVGVWSAKNFNKIVSCWKSILRGCGIGSILGVIPGGGTVYAAFMSYAFEKKFSKTPEKFGKGAIEGLAAAETANNAGSQTSFIPMLGLGIPVNGAMALCLALLLVHGIEPGPNILNKHPQLFWGLIVSMLIGNFMLLAINLSTVPLMVKLLKVNTKYISWIVLALCFIIAYYYDNRIIDCLVLLILGVFGFFLLKSKYDPIGILLGFILGPKLEESLRQSIHIYRQDYLEIFVFNYGFFFYILAIIMLYYFKKNPI